jgi:hypothetical protein
MLYAQQFRIYAFRRNCIPLTLLLHGRKEKGTIGAYRQKSLKGARRIHNGYRSLFEAGQSPAREKQGKKLANLNTEIFRVFAEPRRL